ILIIASKKEMSIELLKIFGFNYIEIGSYGSNLIEKLINIPRLDMKCYKYSKKFNPDIFLGVGSIRAAHVAHLLNKPCIIFNDTEHSREQAILYLPFVDKICTPFCFEKNLGKKQVRFNSYMGLAYLHPIYFNPNPTILENLGLNKNDLFIVIRFVSWNSTHDLGQSGLTNKLELIQELERYGYIFITSEAKLSNKLEKYRLTIPPDKIHDLLYYSSLFIGEGATMASEAAVLGTHAIYVNTLKLGYLTEQEIKYDLVCNINDRRDRNDKVIGTAKLLLEDDNLKLNGKRKREILLGEKIDVTKFMEEIVLSYET
ncbi:MAG: DUF354 domain-containing protein, partial [Methanotrichaceae archaeon]|nr:DUF354 domain-containing protein [Methanotrichaceae archaeon]